jgi:hypothetical protein
MESGSTVFCDCGQGNVVPWESTAAAPPSPRPFPVEPKGWNEAPPLVVPPLTAVPVGEEKIPVTRRPVPDPWDDAPEVRRGDLSAARNPGNCFNHQEKPGQEKCSACGENFCEDCLVKFKGAVLCGPCKNFRLKQNSRPSAVSGKAVCGVILALCSAPVLMCLAPMGINSFAMVVAVLALMAQITATILGGMALRDTEMNPRLSGRSLAITTILTGGLAMLMTVFFLVTAPR